MNKKKTLSLTVLVLCLGIFKLFTYAVKVPEGQKPLIMKDGFHVFAVNLPKELFFAGEKVPMEEFDVRERLDRELLVNTYWQSNTLLLHKRANRWFPVITPILRRYGVPEDFKYLALAESGFLNAESPKGAAGYWQFLEATAKNYGLEVNPEIDERYNVEKATEAACRYLKESHAILGSWSLVAASYNMGLSGVQRQLTKQRVTNYYDLLLNEETFRYLFRILALKEVISKPKDYGYHFRKKDLYAPYAYTTAVIDSSISDLALFAQANGTTYKYLKLLNPWLRDNTLSNKARKIYRIKVLQAGFTGVEEGDFKFIDTTASSGSVFTMPGDASKDLKVTAAIAKENEVVHVVKKGENLKELARVYNVEADAIRMWNSMSKSQNVKAGQKLVIKLPKGKEEQELQE